MELHLKVNLNGKFLDLKDALHSGEIIVDGQRLYSNTAKILLSTLLLDVDGQEIYEDDIICDDKNCKYHIIYKRGTFFAVQQNGDNTMIPLHLLEGSGYIPAKIQKILH